MNRNSSARPLAIITGACSGLGLELARLCGRHGHDLLIAVDRPLFDLQRLELRSGVNVEALRVDLAQIADVEAFATVARGREVGILVAHAGQEPGKAFLDEDFAAVRNAVDGDLTGALFLVYRIGQQMRRIGRGRILITHPVAGSTGTCRAMNDGTRAFVEAFSSALRDELKDSGVSVATPAPRQFCADPRRLARTVFEAMMNDASPAHAMRPAQAGRRS